jgi:hypothetical protein
MKGSTGFEGNGEDEDELSAKNVSEENTPRKIFKNSLWVKCSTAIRIRDIMNVSVSISRTDVGAEVTLGRDCGVKFSSITLCKAG